MARESIFDQNKLHFKNNEFHKNKKFTKTFHKTHNDIRNISKNIASPGSQLNLKPIISG